MSRNARGQMVFKRSQSLKNGFKYSLYGRAAGSEDPFETEEEEIAYEPDTRRDRHTQRGGKKTLESRYYPDDGIFKDPEVGGDTSCGGSFQAIASIFITTVGAGIFALPKSMLSIGIITGMAFVLVASILSLFTHYAILYAHSRIKPSKVDLPADEKRKEPYTAVINEFIPYKCVQALFELVFWIMIAISCVAYYSMLKSYYISFFGPSEPDSPFFSTGNPTLFLVIIAILAAVWTFLKHHCQTVAAKTPKKEKKRRQKSRLGAEGDQESGSGQKCFGYIKSTITYASAAVTIISAFGALIYFAIQGGSSQRSVEDVLYPAPVPEYVQAQSGWYSFLMFIGASIPTLCMSFLSHTNAAHIVRDLPAKGGKESRSICRSRQFIVILITQIMVTILYALVPAFALWAQGSNVDQEDGNILIVMTSQIADHSDPFWKAGIAFQICSALGIIGGLFNIYLPTLLDRTLKLPSVLAACCCCSCCCKSKCRDGCCANSGDYKPVDTDEGDSKDKRLCCGCDCTAFIAPFVTLVLSSACLSVALVSGKGLDIFMGLGGSLSASAIMFIFPCIACSVALFRRLKEIAKRDKESSSPRCWYVIMMIICVATALAGLVFAIFGTLWIFKAGLPTRPSENGTVILPPTNETLIPLVPGVPNFNMSTQFSRF